MYSIQSFSIASRLNNAEFLAFFVNLQKVMGEISTANLGITTEQKAEFDELVKKLTDQVYATMGSEYTAKMQEADERRTAIYKRILTKLQVVNYAENDRELNVLKEVVKQVFLSKYKMQVGSIAQQERTAVISGFIYDLNERLDEDAQETLGVYSDVIALTGSNNSFIASYNSRNLERIEAEKGVTATCRKQLSELFTLVSLLIQYTANQAAEGDAAEKVRSCIDFVQRANGLLEDARVRLNQRLKKEGESGEVSGDGGGGSGQGATGGNGQGMTGDDSPGTGAGSGNGGTGGGGQTGSGSGSGTGGNGGQTVDPGSGAIIDGDMAIL